MALAIDTIELLYSNIYDAFVIVSSDSEYTPLAIKLHESGVYVMGVGEKKTPESFRNACDEFLFLENISATTAEIVPVAEATKAAEPDNTNDDITDDSTDINEIHDLLRKAFDTYQEDDGYVNVAQAGNFIKRAKPDFDCCSFGYTKLPQLLEAFPDKYEVSRYPGKGTVTIVGYKCVDKID